MHFALNEDQIAVRDMAREFAAEKIAPHAIRWDEEKHFPVDVMREAAALGIGGVYIRDDVGGSGLSRVDAALIFEALAMGCPTVSAFISIHNMASWMIDAFGNEAQRHQWLPKLCTMELLASYCLTEPGSGSDAAALRTRAVRDGDMFRVKGRKIWTTQAHQSRWCTLYARTDPDAPKHRGISCLILDLESPGVTIEPIRMASISDETFCEVILDDVEIPADSLLGPANGGWQVAMSSLNHERQMIWIMNWVEIQRGLSSVRDSQATHDDYASGEVFAELGSLLADAEALRATGYRALNNELAGRPSPEADILKLLGSQTLQRVWELSAAAAGPVRSTTPICSSNARTP